MHERKTISYSFTVSTIEDGISVQAQYAPNANPTTEQIHNVWVDGDLYMRTKESDSSTWSAWHRIVGESGDETDFSFGISSYKTTGNPNIPPSDISSWADAPIEVTTSKPYLWARVQKKVANGSSYVVESTSYIRLTGEDGYTVEAQYAPNDDPEESQIHTTWMDGDLYMRTKQSNESTWSNWHLIVGEKGGETDYTFNISKSLTSASSTTPPANCYYPQWQDAPKATTDAYPYLWTKIVKRTWNSATQSYDDGTPSYVRMTGEMGASPYIADLDNQMDSIMCDSNGKVYVGQSITTTISMFSGFSVEPFVVDSIKRNGTTMIWDGNNDGVWPRWDSSTKILTIEYDTNASIDDKDDFEITLHSANVTTISRSVHLIVNGIRSNAVYRLIPSVSQVVKKKDGSYTPSTYITCIVQKVENGNPSTPLPSEYTLEKSLNGDAYIPYSVTQPSQITTDLKFRLKIDGSIVDIETIPLVQDGSKGDNAIEYAIVFTNAWARVDNDGIITARMAGHAYIINGTSRTPLANATIRYGYILNDADTYTTTTTNASGFFDTETWFDGDEISTYAKNSGNIFAAIVIGGTNVVCVEYVTIAKQGENGTSIVGPRGKVGRFFYYAGIFDASDTVTTFVVNDAQSPYFFYDNKYWVYNPENNPAGGISTMFAMGTPSSESASWKIMTSDFKYIITEAIFGSYAHFGGAIINGDYLMSQYGYMLGFCNTKTPINDNTQYQNVDVDDILGEDDMYDPTKLIWNDSNQREITSTAYTTIISASFVQNRYYTLEIDENTEVSGNELLWTIVSQSGTEIASGTIISTETGTNKNCINFKSTVSTTCYLRVKIANRNDNVVISGFYLRFSKFIPYLAMDLLAGKFVANNIIARGELHADSLYHTMVYGYHNEDRFTINDESIINLGTTAVDTTVILPSPLACKGRVVELFNHSTRFYTTWVGAETTSAFSAAYGSGFGIRVIDPISYKYIKFYCDGTNWWILKAEV